jgi:hypothetical protein
MGYQKEIEGIETGPAADCIRRMYSFKRRGSARRWNIESGSVSLRKEDSRAKSEFIYSKGRVALIVGVAQLSVVLGSHRSSSIHPYYSAKISTGVDNNKSS